jgi:hypothetical protein
MSEPEEKEELKVRDRRRFTAEGASQAETSSPSGEPGESARGAEPPPGTTRGEDTQEGRAAQDEATDPGPLDFTSFIISMATNALHHLGLLKIGDQEPKKDLTAARQVIDIIALLEEKTKGNLTDQEQRILKDALFQLRMAFVDASKK